MNTLLWVVMLLLLGLVTGKIVGALTAFTRGPAVYDLLAGGLCDPYLASFATPSVV